MAVLVEIIQQKADLVVSSSTYRAKEHIKEVTEEKYHQIGGDFRWPTSH